MEEHFLMIQFPLILLILEVSVSADYYDAMKSSRSAVTDLSPDPNGEALYGEQDYSSYSDDMNLSEEGRPQARGLVQQSDCETTYQTVSVVKAVPSFSKHCHQVQDTKCKTVFKNAFQTQVETQCVASFDTRSGWEF